MLEMANAKWLFLNGFFCQMTSKVKNQAKYEIFLPKPLTFFFFFFFFFFYDVRNVLWRLSGLTILNFDLYNLIDYK